MTTSPIILKSIPGEIREYPLLLRFAPGEVPLYPIRINYEIAVLTTFAGTASGLAIVSALYRATARVQGASFGAGVVTAQMKGIVKFTGASFSGTVVSGVYTSSNTYIAAVNGTANASGVFKAIGRVQGASFGVSVVAAQIKGVAQFTGASVSGAVISGVYTSNNTYLGVVSGISAASGVFKAIGRVTGLSAGTGTASGVYVSQTAFSGAATGTANVSATFKATARAQGTASGLAIVSASFKATAIVVGASVGVANVSGTLKATAKVVGVSAGVASVSGVYASGSGGGGYDINAQAFFTAANISDISQKNAVNQLVLDLKSASIWTKMKAVYPMVGGTASSHKWNLKDLRELDAAFRLTFPNGATHSANGTYFTGDQQAKTFLNVSNVCPNALTVGTYISSQGPTQEYDYNILFGAFVQDYSNYLAYAGYINSLLVYLGANADYLDTNKPFSTFTGLITASASANSYEAYFGSTLVASKLATYVGVNSTLTINNNSYGLNGTVSLFFVSDSHFTQAEMTALDSAVETYQTALGRAV